MNGGSMATPDDDLLGPVVESFLDRFRRGERPALTELMARHPELAGQIRELIPALVELEQLGGSAGDFIPSPAPGPGTRGFGGGGPSPERLGDYLILRWLGGGGMGVVYEAEHESLKSRVALKVMHPRFRADPKYLLRFHAEARLAAGLHHTNIVSVFDYGEQDGVCYYAMQFIQGQPLDRVLADIRRLRDDDTNAGGLVGPDAILTIPAAAVSLATTAAVQGLLTGRFAAPTRPITTTTATGEAALATVALAAGDPESSGHAICRASETHQYQEARSTEEGPEQPVASEPSTLGSSSLGGSGELRYFRQIARVGAQVADALEYAHCRGVLHRDIKPSNLLLDALGNVWVTDFGLAKLMDGDDLSQSRELAGTLRYMAPERFRGESDRRADVYSLGATLYELLALRPPFEESDQIRLIELIRNDAPAPPRQLDRHVPRDLETIVLKALAKDPKDRFGTAGELADELRRFVEGRPIRSRPVSFVERFWRWCKRDPWLAGADIAAALLIFVLAAVSTTAAIVYRNQAEALRVERGRSDGAAVDARWRAVDAYTAQARAGRFSRRPGQRFESLEAVSQASKLLDGLPSGPDSASRRESLRDLAIAALALPDLRPTGRVIHQPPGVIASAFDPTMTRYALRFRDGAISVRRVADDQEVTRFSARGDRTIAVFGFSPDGRYLATTHYPSYALTVWDVDRGVVAMNDRGPVVNPARFSPDSRRLALVNTSRELIVYDLATGRRSGRWSVPGLGNLAFRPDGAQIAVINNESNPPTCRILEGETGRLVQTISLRAGADYVAWSPDGTTLAIPSDDRKIDLWDNATGTLRATLEGHINRGLRAAFHPAGTLLASYDWSGQLRLWDSVLGRPLLNLRSDSGPEFSRDGRIVVGLEDQLPIYQVDPALEYRTFAHASREPMNYARPSVRHDGRVLAVGTDRGAVLWDLARGTELAFLPIDNAWHLMFEPSGDLITSGSRGVSRWPIQLDAGRGEFRIGPPRPLRLPAGQCGIAEDRSGRIVAKADQAYAYVATPLRTTSVGPLDDCRSVAVSPDGQWLATGTHAGSHGAQVWRISDFTKVADLPLDYGTGVDFSPDGRWLITGAPPCRLWEVGTWREVRQIGGQAWCFSPDGRQVVVVDASKVIRLVEAETGRTLARLESPDLCDVWPTFSPDGSRLVVTTNNGPAAHIWDLRAIRKHLAGMGLDWDAPAYSDDDPATPSAPRFARVQVNCFEYAIAEGAVLGREGRWEEAAAAYARAFSYGAPGHPRLWFEHVMLRLAVGDAAGYRSSCRHVLDPFRVPGKDEGELLVFAAHAYALAPDGPVERAQALLLAQRRAAVFSDVWSEHVLGLALYRAGRFAEAEARLLGSLDRYPGWDLQVLDWLVLAMAQQRLSRPSEARRWQQRAESWAAARLRGRPGEADRAVPENWQWTNEVLVDLLLREARALLRSGPPKLPADVFGPEPSAAPATSVLTANAAIGGLAGAGGSDGDGRGGGLYVTSGGVVTLHKSTVAPNFASFSNNNIYGAVMYV